MSANHSRSAAATALEDAFRSTGIFVHATTSYGRFSKDVDQQWLRRTMASRRLPPEVERDCGAWCSAASFLHADLPFVTFSQETRVMPIALVYRASDEVWDEVQCASVTDSVSRTRACCACMDHGFCPFKHFETVNSGLRAVCVPATV
jgi:hypothetical protein|eukprot:4114460-Prymnesium_polylepis.2